MAESNNSRPQPRAMRAVARALPADGAVNVGDGERWLSLLGGGLLALYYAASLLGDGRAPRRGRRPPVSGSERAVCAVSGDGRQHRGSRPAVRKLP